MKNLITITEYTVELKEPNGYYDIDRIALETNKYSTEQVLERYTKMRIAQSEKLNRPMFIHAQIRPHSFTRR